MRALSQSRKLSHSRLLPAPFGLQLRRWAEVRRGEVGRQCALECAQAVPRARQAGAGRSRFQMLPRSRGSWEVSSSTIFSPLMRVFI